MTTGETGLAVRQQNGALAPLDSERLAMIKATLSPDLSDDQLLFFGEVCNRLKLDPFKRQIYAIVRKEKAEDGSYHKRMTIQTSIDGLRAAAERTRKYKGQVGPWWCGEDGVWKEVWLSKDPPAAAKVGVLKTGFKEPLYAVARYSSYVQKFGDKVAGMWVKMADNQLAKCAEALALRRAFPDDLGGIYAEEEMAQAENPPPADVRVLPGPPEEPKKPRPVLSDEQRMVLTRLGNTVDKKWPTAKYVAQLEQAGGYQGVLAVLVREHELDHGPECEHIKGLGQVDREPTDDEVAMALADGVGEDDGEAVQESLV